MGFNLHSGPLTLLFKGDADKFEDNRDDNAPYVPSLLHDISGSSPTRDFAFTDDNYNLLNGSLTHLLLPLMAL